MDHANDFFREFYRREEAGRGLFISDVVDQTIVAYGRMGGREMARKTVDLSLIFEEDEEGYQHLGSVVVTGSYLSKEELDNYIETLCQSDFFTIGFPYGIAEAMDHPGRVVNFHHASY